jgi:hypothetical protein
MSLRIPGKISLCGRASLLEVCTNLTFLPQVCQFCFNNIKNNMNGLCPACRRPYDEKTIEWKVVTPEEYVTSKKSSMAGADIFLGLHNSKRTYKRMLRRKLNNAKRRPKNEKSKV